MGAGARPRSSGTVAVLIGALLGGCFFFPPDDPPPPGPDAGRDAGPDTSPWLLHDLARGPYEPGTWLTFEVERVDVDPRETWLWVLEGDRAFPFHAVRREHPPHPRPTLYDDGGVAPDVDAGPGDAGAGDETFALALPLPIVRAGTYHVAVGTHEGPQTRALEVEVTVPSPRMTQAQAADALREGLVGLHADAVSLLRADAPEWQSYLAETGAEDVAAGIESMAADVAAAADVERAIWMMIPADDEPGLQAFLWNAGMLASFAERGAPGATFAPRGGDLESALVRSPEQGIRFGLDVLSMELGALGLIADVVEIVGAAITLPAGGEGALPGAAAKIVISIVRIAIDDFVSSDLVEIVEVQAPRLAFAGEGFMAVAWGRFEPQNNTAGAQIRSLEDFIFAVVGAALPGSGRAPPGLRNLIDTAARYVRDRLPTTFGNFLFNAVDPPIPMPPVLLPLDLAYYNVSFADVLTLNPVLIPLTYAIRAIYDPDLISPVDAIAARGGTGVSATVGYARRDVELDDIPFTGAGIERTFASLSVRGVSFTTEGPTVGGVQLIQLPFPRFVGGTHRLYVQSAPDPAVPNQRISDEDWIVLDVNLPGGGTTRSLRPDTTPLRVHTIALRDLFTSFDTTTVDVIVDGTTQYAGLAVTGGVSVPLTLRPGPSDVEVVGTGGHTALTCSDGSEVCIEIQLPDADNADRSVALRGAVGASRTIRVWTPPLLETAM